jgi:hypothetical protein
MGWEVPKDGGGLEGGRHRQVGKRVGDGLGHVEKGKDRYYLWAGSTVDCHAVGRVGGHAVELAAERGAGGVGRGPKDRANRKVPYWRFSYLEKAQNHEAAL